MVGYRLYLQRKLNNIKNRCRNPNKDYYYLYGGKGIKVCDEWLDYGCNNFIEWALFNGWKRGLDLDRRDSSKDYCPENCRWITPRQNALNQSFKKRNKSGYRGVYYFTARKKWAAQITINRKQIPLGCFLEKEAAVKTRNQYIIDNNLQHEYPIQEWKD